jgi:hypothetical protein
MEKHMANAGFPALDSREAQENVLESVYYHRPKSDRRDVNTVFFADPGAIAQDLHDMAGENVDYGPEYTTTNTYPAVTVIRVYKGDGYKKAQIQHGEAKPVVKINNHDGDPAFNHLQKTNPKELAGKLDLDI